MDTVPTIDKLECQCNNCSRHKSSVLLISTLWSLILLGYLFFTLKVQSSSPIVTCIGLSSIKSGLTVFTWVKPIFTKRECREGEAKSFCCQVWWKIAIVWVLPSPSLDTGHSDTQKCHSSDTSDILETLQFANGSHLVEVKAVHAHTHGQIKPESRKLNYTEF